MTTTARANNVSIDLSKGDLSEAMRESLTPGLYSRCSISVLDPFFFFLCIFLS